MPAAGFTGFGLNFNWPGVKIDDYGRSSYRFVVGSLVRDHRVRNGKESSRWSRPRTRLWSKPNFFVRHLRKRGGMR